MRQIFLTLILFLPTIVNATGVFQGAWLYSSKSCDNRYSYQYSLIQKGLIVEGTYSEGNNQKVYGGELKGTVRKNKLFVQFCSDGSWGNEPNICPNFRQVSGYFIRKGSKLVWHENSTYGLSHAIVLHRIAENDNSPLWSHCYQEDGVELSR